MLKPYPEYKDSGIEWIGPVPRDWSVKRLKFVADINPPRLAGMNDETQCIFIPMEAMNSDGTFDQSSRRPLAEVKTGFTCFAKNDVIFAKITPCFENRKGALLRGLTTDIGFGSTEFHVLRMRKGKTISRFLYYLSISGTFRRLGEAFMQGVAGQKRVTNDFVRDFFTTLPSEDEQEQIADFLDRKTAQIDDLIAKKQRMIELLTEERAAVINQAVIKGLSQDYLFDTNAFDRLLQEDTVKLDAKIFVTHIQKDQIEAIPQDKAEKKGHLLDLLHVIGSDKIPTSVAVWDVSKWDECCWGTDANNELWQKISKTNGAQDALIAVTAIDRSLTLVTDDKNLLRDVNKEGGQAITFDEFQRGVFTEFKDSGIEWLDKVPKHWEIKKLKFNALVQFSNVNKKSEEGEIPVRLCNYVDVYYNDFITPDLAFMEATASVDEIKKFHLKTGDVLLTKDSEEWTDIAVPAYMSFEKPDLICGYHLAQVRPKETLILGKYLFWFLSANSVNCQFQVEASGVTRYGLSNYALSNSFCLIPPKKEQEAIISYLDKKTVQIDGQVARELRSIELLKEYRTALISEAVTGKFDVRGQ